MVSVAACKRPATSKSVEEGCLALPAAVRDSLVASPDGQSLYWEELARNYDYDGELEATWNLVRYDLGERRATEIVSDVTTPIRFVGGDLVVPRYRDGNPRLTLVGHDGHLQELTPVSHYVEDVELVNSHTIAFLAEGVGARAVYTLDLAELRPYALVDADALLTTAGDNVLVRVDDDIAIVDPKTKQTSRVPYPRKSTVLGEHLFLVDGESVIEQDVRTGSPKPVISKPGNWKLVYQGDSVLARTPPDDDKSFAYVLTGSNAKQLPTVVGGASIIATTDSGSKTWALIAHNTSNYIGDVADTTAEADVCLLPARDQVSYPTRQVPARFVDRSQALFDAVKAMSPDATLQIMDGARTPGTLHIFLWKERVGSDFALMRKLTRQVHDDVTRLLSDREVMTSVTFGDRRDGYQRWRRDRLRDRITVGMGDALVASPDDFDFEVSERENKIVDGKITCKGVLRNLANPIDHGFDIQCSGNRAHLIHIDKLGANETHRFDQTFERSEVEEAALLRIIVDGKPSEPLFKEDNERSARLFDVAAAAFDETALWLYEHTVTKYDIGITLHAEPNFLQAPAADQEAAIKKAYDRYTAFRSIYERGATVPLTMHVEVERTDVSFDYDGSLFQRN
jgi:hypothetical protein